MVRAIRLNPQPKDYGQCEADRLHEYWNEKLYPDKRCKHGAKYEIGGIKLCARHAGIKALAILTNEDYGETK